MSTDDGRGMKTIYYSIKRHGGHGHHENNEDDWTPMSIEINYVRSIIILGKTNLKKILINTLILTAEGIKYSNYNRK